MKTILCVVLYAAAASFAQVSSAYIGNKYILGDTAWYQTHSVKTTHIAVSTAAKTADTKLEQTIYHHQYTVRHDSNGVVLGVEYDSLRIAFHSDSLHVIYDSNNPADSAQMYAMLVFPSRALLQHPLFFHITPKGKVDSVAGLDSAIFDASRLLPRSAEIAKLRKALDPAALCASMQSSLLELPDTDIVPGRSVRFDRARMEGEVQFIDRYITTLQRFTGDTAILSRQIYTRIASPVIPYGGARCIVDSCGGGGIQNILFDVRRGIIAGTSQSFAYMFRAFVPNSKTTITQSGTSSTEETLVHYAVYKPSVVGKKHFTRRRRR